MNPDASAEQLFEYLGSPTVVVENYMSRFDRKALEKAYRRSKWILALSILGIAAVAMLILFWTMYSMQTVKIVENPMIVYAPGHPNAPN